MRSIWVGFPTAPYTHQSALHAANKVLGKEGWQVFSTEVGDESPQITKADVYFGTYDLLPFEDVHPVSGEQLQNSEDLTQSINSINLSNVPYPQLSSYVIRKSLIRKNYLAHSLHLAKVKKGSTKSYEAEGVNGRGLESYKAKGIQKGPHSEQADEDIAPQTWVFEATSAEDLDELLTDDLYDVRILLEKNEEDSLSGENRSWFILKPAMADQGMGIRLFDSVQALEAIFEEFEPESDEEDEEEEGEGNGNTLPARSSTAVAISQVRQFVIQEYLNRPLLVQAPTLDSFHKFHIRAYVLAQGGLRVFLYDEMLALFAPSAYVDPCYVDSGDGECVDLSAHLTNTSRQDDEQSQRTVHLLSDLKGCKIGSNSGFTTFKEDHINAIRNEVAGVIAETFEACVKAGRIHFQPWPNAWEIFGIDLMVTLRSQSRNPKETISPEDLRVWLLETNAQPDFAKSGDRLQSKIDTLFERALQITVLGQEGEDQHATHGQSKWKPGKSRDGMTLCLDLPLSSGGW